MMRRRYKVFLDTSVIFAAVLSETGGARKLFRLGDVSMISLLIGSNVLRECEEVVRRKVPSSLPMLAYLLELGRVDISTQSPEDLLEQAKATLAYEPNAYVLAEAIASEPDWFVTHDKVHFLGANLGSSLSSIRIGTPGDILQALEDDFTRDH